MALVWRCDACGVIKEKSAAGPYTADYAIRLQHRCFEFCSPACLKNFAVNHCSA